MTEERIREMEDVARFVFLFIFLAVVLFSANDQLIELKAFLIGVWFGGFIRVIIRAALILMSGKRTGTDEISNRR